MSVRGGRVRNGNGHAERLDSQLPAVVDRRATALRMVVLSRTAMDVLAGWACRVCFARKDDAMPSWFVGWAHVRRPQGEYQGAQELLLI